MPTIPLSQITIKRDERQRRELTDIEELAASIADVGLINPLIVDENNILIAGERRHTAITSLGWLEVEVRYFSDLDTQTKHKIELEENIRRVDLAWPDRVKAISDYHLMCLEADDAWTQEATADRLHLDRSTVSQHLLVAQHMDTGIVAEAPQFSTAHNAARRVQTRAAASTKREIDANIADLFGDTPETTGDLASSSGASPPPFPFEIQQANFNTWAETYTGEPFNLIHCDFPYGVNVGDKVGQSGAKVTGQYADTEEIYWELINSFLTHQDRFVADSAHLIFWFSMDYYTATMDAFATAGWRVNPFPLIWYKSNNKGIIPDANRGPRRIYETALLASRGDRPIVQVKSNVAACPTDNELHQAQKPLPMLDHFFQMLVDEYSRVLDPTCGSGNSIQAAAERGAASGLGLELLPEFVNVAEANLAETNS
jgi:ParB/RepB/Spo0J family partition protein